MLCCDEDKCCSQSSAEVPLGRWERKCSHKTLRCGHALEDTHRHISLSSVARQRGRLLQRAGAAETLEVEMVLSSSFVQRGLKWQTSPPSCCGEDDDTPLLWKVKRQRRYWKVLYVWHKQRKGKQWISNGGNHSEISKLSFTCVKKIMTNLTCSTVVNLKTTEETMLSDYEVRGHQATHDTTAMG